MLRNVIPALCLICLAACCAVTISCSGSSKFTTTNCNGPSIGVAGNWTFTPSSGGSGFSTSGPGVINSSGLAVFFQTTTTTPAPGDTVILPTITGAPCFSGTATAYGTPASGGGSVTDSVQGTVNSATSITGTISHGNTFSLAPNSPLTGSVTAISGSMHGEIEGAAVADILQLTFIPTGDNSSTSFTGSDGFSCTVTGTFNQEGGDLSTLNVFDTSITFSGSGCPASGTLTGVGFESSSDYFSMNGKAQGTYFYAASSSSAAVFEIFP